MRPKIKWGDQPRTALALLLNLMERIAVSRSHGQPVRLASWKVNLFLFRQIFKKPYNFSMQKEVYISVDVETAGPYPGQYAMLSIGACLVDDTSTTFYVELQPDRSDYLPEALAISGLSLDLLKQKGVAPQKAMQDFADWLSRVVPHDSRSVFVALNAPFDWMFINDYFYRYLGRNPFGHSGLDIKAFSMGLTGVSWSETSMKDISSFLQQEKSLDHNALHDAQNQADIFRELRKRSQKRSEEIHPLI